LSDQDFTWTLELPVSTSRPYVVDEWRRYRVMAADAVEASLMACQMALCTAMPMSAGVIVGCEY
jgi:hypothetical protein